MKFDGFYSLPIFYKFAYRGPDRAILIFPPLWTNFAASSGFGYAQLIVIQRS
jgi:hypothetical protein